MEKGYEYIVNEEVSFFPIIEYEDSPPNFKIYIESSKQKIMYIYEGITYYVWMNSNNKTIKFSPQMPPSIIFKKRMV
jgi:hypothetical protein